MASTLGRIIGALAAVAAAIGSARAQEQWRTIDIGPAEGGLVQAIYPSLRTGHGAARWRGSVWSVAGTDVSRQLRNSVQHSTDGRRWYTATDSAAFSPRTRTGVAAFRDRLWLIGGRDSTGTRGDVWSTGDGVQWRLEAAQAIPPREGHTVTMFRDQLVVIGGTDGTYRSDVWVSDDGVAWREASAAAFFPGREGHAAAVLDGFLHVVGGLTPAGLSSDVWRTADGVLWEPVSQAVRFPERSGHALAEHDGTLMLVAGRGGAGLLADVWASTDASTWTRLGAEVPFEPRENAALLPNGDGVLLFGGIVPSGRMGKAWGSTDGTTWKEPTGHGRGAEYRYGTRAVTFRGRMFLLGGIAAEWSVSPPPVRLSYSSADGYLWSYESYCPFSSITRAIEFAGRLRVWGYDEAEEGYWTSENGQQWRREESAELPNNGQGLSMIAYRGRLWLVGGSSSSGDMSCVWLSGDGLAWREETCDAAFGDPTGGGGAAGRSFPILVVFQDRLWAIGGTKPGAYSTEDGIDWRREPGLDFFPAQGGVAYAEDGTLVIHSGRAKYSSSDGVTWKQERASMDVGGRSFQHLGGRSFMFDLGFYFSQFEPTRSWVSDDGVAWKEITSGAPLGPFATLGTRLVARDGWSEDGVNWTPPRGQAPPASDEIASGAGRVWVHVRGTNPTLWTSTDGEEWEQRPSPSRTEYGTIGVFGDRVWIYDTACGESAPCLMTAYASMDGYHWEEQDKPPFSARYNALTVKVQGRDLLIGGSKGCTQQGCGESASDAWATDDGGETWQQVTANLPYKNTSYGRATVHVDDAGSLVMLTAGLAAPRKWVSEDGGATWSPEIYLPEPPLTIIDRAPVRFRGTEWLFTGTHTLYLGDGQEAEVSAEALSFGGVPLGNTATRRVAVANDPTRAAKSLLVTATRIVGAGAGSFAIGDAGPLPLAVLVGHRVEIPIAFSASTLGEATATLEIETDDPSTPLLRVALRGAGYDGSGATGLIAR